MAQLNILRFSQVQKKTGLCRSSIKNYARDGTFPAPIKLGNRAVGFIESEVNQWIAERAEASRQTA